MTSEVERRHEKLALESGVEFIAPISVACVRGFRLCSRATPQDLYNEEVKDAHARKHSHDCK